MLNVVQYLCDLNRFHKFASDASREGEKPFSMTG